MRRRAAQPLPAASWQALTMALMPLRYGKVSFLADHTTALKPSATMAMPATDATID
jgi:ABC-type uncharacterized transport system ATPase component